MKHRHLPNRRTFRTSSVSSKAPGDWIFIHHTVSRYGKPCLLALTLCATIAAGTISCKPAIKTNNRDAQSTTYASSTLTVEHETDDNAAATIRASTSRVMADGSELIKIYKSSSGSNAVNAGFHTERIFVEGRQVALSIKQGVTVTRVFDLGGRHVYQIDDDGDGEFDRLILDGFTKQIEGYERAEDGALVKMRAEELDSIRQERRALWPEMGLEEQ